MLNVIGSTFGENGKITILKSLENVTGKNDTAIGIRGNDGCILLMRNIVFNEINKPESECKLHSIEYTIGMITCGYKNQSTLLFEYVNNNAQNFRRKFHSTIPLKKLSDDLSCFMNQRTFKPFTSPFCVFVILCTWSEINGAELFCIEPTGDSHSYFGCAVGKWKQQAKEEISKLSFNSLSLKELLGEGLMVMSRVHGLDIEENKAFESILTAFWIGNDTAGRIMNLTLDFDEIISKI